ncbi:MAG: hypothetical protein LLG05_12725 [Porphyromonadaceae bacterium]|nr:hypothetical protein [Porphyromonadaceae bacterium]
MKLAAQIGIPYSEFLKITPRILNAYADGYSQRRKSESKDNIYQAYLISRWVWEKKIDIEKILGCEEKKKIMTDNEMLAQVKALNKLFGGEVKEIGAEE